LVNPESSTVPKFSRKYSVMVRSKEFQTERSHKQSQVKLKPISYQTKIIVDAPNE
jgi:hypothetical protein